ncbi:hypothetical protein SEUCBS140593_001362 [Sporothrix eucalyptigena]|uniref:DUF7896 domain-containing protein n=1 Tax=Sporothrix eucalyptigena TaxID=1812306 RepID=A0ABP0AXK4_9PEZI
MDATTQRSHLSVRNNRRNSAGVPMNLVPIVTPADAFDEDSIYADSTVQPPPLKRSRTTQSSRHVNTSPTSASMMSYGSTPGPSAAHMPSPSNIAIPRRYAASQMQSVLPYRQNHEHLQDVNEMDVEVGMDPEQYLQKIGCYTETNQASFAAIDGQSMHIEMDQSDYAAQGYTVPSTYGSLTEATTLDGAMSVRFSDGYNDASSQPPEMVQVNSQSSYVMPFSATADSSHIPGYTYSPGLDTCQDSSYLGSDEAVRGTGSKYLNTNFSGVDHQSPSIPSYLRGGQSMQRTESINTLSSFGMNSSPSAEMFAFSESTGQQLHAPVEMERSLSTSSARSNISLRIRAKDSLRRQNDNASKTQIQPKKAPVIKAADPADVPYASSSSNRAGRGSDLPSAGNKNGKMEIPKAKRERYKHEKLFCDLCKQHPNGFRGEHELRRHKSSKHAVKVKKWICRDPHMYGIETSIDVIRPLSECKHCNEKKTYGIDYNAAAHLRRTHFKEKPARKSSGSTKAGEKKSSSHDADVFTDLPMSELKKWMVEITVTRDQTHYVAEADDAEAEDYSTNAAEIDWDLLDESGETAAVHADDDDFLGMGDAFSGDAAVTASVSMVRGGVADRRTIAHETEFQAEMPKLDGFHQPMYYQEGPISSANFFEPQMNTHHLPLELAGFVSSDIVSSPSGTTITQGTAHPYTGEQHLESPFSQPYGVDGLDFSFLSPDM